MNKRICACSVFLFSLVINVLEAGQTKNRIDKNSQRLDDFAQFSYILIQGTDNYRELKEKIEVIYPKVIADFKKFTKEHPASFLVDDAKLKIAQFHNLTAKEVYEPHKNLKIDGIKFNPNWKKEANKWLKDIVKNNKQDKFFDLDHKKETDTPTATFALYYLAIWNDDTRFLIKLIKDYPESELAKKSKPFLTR